MRQLLLAPLIGMLMVGVPVLLLSSPGGTSASALERTSWTVEARPDAAAAARGEQPFAQTLAFSDGNVSVEEQRSRGFAPAKYSVANSGYAWSFTAEQKSRAAGELAWAAEITGNSMAGNLVWTKSDGSVARYHIRGQRL